MGLIVRLIGGGLTPDKIPVHVWPKLFDSWKRGRVTLTAMLDAFDLTDKTEEIVSVVTGTDKLGLSVSHTWNNDDGIYLTTTGVVPGGTALETVYYVIDSNPGAGTVKISLSKSGAAVDLTSGGSGTHTLNRIDPDVIFWDEERLAVTSTGGNADQKLRRQIWDLLTEGNLEIAEEGIAFTTESEIKTEMTELSSWLTVS